MSEENISTRHQVLCNSNRSAHREIAIDQDRIPQGSRIISFDPRSCEMLIIFLGKISAQPHPTLCIQFLNRGNNDKNNTFPLGKQICFTIVWGCAETLPISLISEIFDKYIRIEIRYADN